MAAVNSDQYGSDKKVPAVVSGGALTCLFGSVTLTAAQSANDTVNLFTMPKGFTPLFGFLLGDDIDTGTEAYDIDIGTAADPDAFGNLGVQTGDAVTGIKPETCIWMPLAGTLCTAAPVRLTADTDCILTVIAAANAGGTGTLNVILMGTYNDPRVL
jgi:hypothetical protein